jgi:hypothetical protein
MGDRRRKTLSLQLAAQFGQPAQSVAQISKSAVSQVSKPARYELLSAAADLEISAAADFEVCATRMRPSCG